ncbi:FIMAH domain-containing protein [Actinoplanes ianthinogenes]
MHDPRPSAPHWPTAVLPTVPEHDRYAAGRRRRRIVLGAAGAFLALAVGYWAVSGPGDDDTPVAAAPSAPVLQQTTALPTIEATTEPAPSTTPTSEPTTEPTTEPVARVRPGVLLQQMQRELGLLVRRRQLERDDAGDLSKRLRRVGESLRKQDEEKAAERLQDFAEKLVDLHDDGDISQDGFTALADAAAQLGTRLPQQD